MPIISDRNTVISLANTTRRNEPSLTAREAARKALHLHFGLAPFDGIWGGSDAAICMDYRNRSDGDNLLDEIVQDVANAMSDGPETFDTAAPRHCPWCGGAKLTSLEGWSATSESEPDHTETLTEYQCANEGAACETRAFWA